MKILVTGGAGFIGSYTVNRLIEEGHDVVVLDNLSSGKISNINKDVRLIIGDITDSDLIKHLNSLQFNAVIHLAAQTSVPFSVKEPVEDMNKNIKGTINLLKALETLNVKKIIFASSAAVYGNQTHLPISESFRCQPDSPYGISKLAAEFYIIFFCKRLNIEYNILRYANVYGPNQSKNGEGGVVNIFAERALKGKALTIYGDGNQTRDFIYVKDVANANVAALTAKSGIFNVSNNVETSIINLINVIQKYTTKEIKLIYESKNLGDIDRSLLSNSSIIKNTDWKPKFSISSGIEDMINNLLYIQDKHTFNIF